MRCGRPPLLAAGGSLLSDRTPSSDSTLYDAFVGIRYRKDFAERWVWSVRVDAGGGDTDYTWQGALSVGVRVGRDGKNTLAFGYRHLEYEFGDGGDGITDNEIEFSGPFLGFSFSI